MQTTSPPSLPASLEDFASDLDELNTAEDFLDYFGIPFALSRVQVNRLHILQRFHDYLAASEPLPDSVDARFRCYVECLHTAYQDFVTSDAQTEKVFRVFHLHEPRQVSIGIDALLASRPVTPVRMTCDATSV